MSARPYVTLSCAMSIDGRLDAARPRRLALSNGADLDRVDGLRAQHDAIMVGAATIRRDDPRLLVKSPARRAALAAHGRPEPARVTLTASGNLPASARLFTVGEARRLVYSPDSSARRLRARLGDRATVIGVGAKVRIGAVLDDLAGARGVRRLMVEGGGVVLTQFLEEELADELQLVIAPFFVGEAGAPQAFRPARFPWTESRRATLAETRPVGDVVLLRYALSERARERVRAEWEQDAQPALQLP
jgi:5-amino-6-(5-phosphoribosylamino)uracil reductase